MTTTSTAHQWLPLDPGIATRIIDSRLQLHYAAQFATALGISYLAPRSDDSHTNLGWDRTLEALVSREVHASSHAVRVAIRPLDLTLLVLVDGSIAHRIPLHRSSIAQVENALRTALASAGLDGLRFTLRRHYELPPHPVADGAPFDSSRTNEFSELAAWFANGAVLMEEMKAHINGAEVRCWPHHFDIATLAIIGRGSSGAGMLPGDAMWPEPYYYVNAYPVPNVHMSDAPLEGGGQWNTDGWFGAVLIGSRLTSDAAAQADQIRAFLRSAFDACSATLR